MNGLQHSTLTDGFAFGITALVAIVATPAVGLKVACRYMLKHPTNRERWQPPGVPDAAAGEWPTGVVGRLAEAIAGLTEEYKEDRILLPDALATLAEIERTARRVFGGTHPLTEGFGHNLSEARGALRARERPDA